MEPRQHLPARGLDDLAVSTADELSQQRVMTGLRTACQETRAPHSTSEPSSMHRAPSQMEGVVSELTCPVAGSRLAMLAAWTMPKMELRLTPFLAAQLSE
eukprot:671530-Rhodomonas_salina.1